ncbi:hypothetical protein MRB53_014540 [Persea americana]|uniref:Uncharacterized protein n=1 Tax=Persea americana TaxID=3435 RepID=A0ACC2KB28_PERAE|nr:hypothetical protein MRB53_014540 [Persea americana]
MFDHSITREGSAQEQFVTKKADPLTDHSTEYSRPFTFSWIIISVTSKDRLVICYKEESIGHMVSEILENLGSSALECWSYEALICNCKWV